MNSAASRSSSARESYCYCCTIGQVLGALSHWNVPNHSAIGTCKFFSGLCAVGLLPPRQATNHISLSTASSTTSCRHVAFARKFLSLHSCFIVAECDNSIIADQHGWAHLISLLSCILQSAQGIPRKDSKRVTRTIAKASAQESRVSSPMPKSDSCVV